jgi:uncharacterized membrane protein YcfT
MRWSERRVYLFAIDAFAALSALAGGVGVMAGWIKFPAEWLTGSRFNWLISNYFEAGAILFLVVGGSALAATIATLVRRDAAVAISFTAGLVMIGWIVGEIAIIGQFAWLQLVYFAVGVAMMVLAVRFARDSRAVKPREPMRPISGRVILPR